MLPRALRAVVIPTRTIFALASILLLPTALASGSIVLFEDAAGDAGPIAAWGAPTPGLSNGHADLLRAELSVTGATALLALRLSALPDSLPPDVVWFVGWEGDDGAYRGVGYTRVVTPEHPMGAEGASLCVFEGSPQEDPEPECEDVPATRLADGFDFELPLAALGDGRLAAPEGAVVRIPDATAWPLFVAHFTGLTLEDHAEGEDALVPLATTTPDEVVAHAADDATRPVPGMGALGALAAAGVALTRRGRAG